MALFDGAEHEDELGGQHVFAPHRLELRTGRRFVRDARGEGMTTSMRPGSIRNRSDNSSRASRLTVIRRLAERSARR